MSKFNALPLGVRIAVCITFHYAAERLIYLQRVLSNFSPAGDAIDVTVITNTADDDHRDSIVDAGSTLRQGVSIYPALNLGHPFLLPWWHFNVMRQKIQQDYTHFLYMEDDLDVRLSTLSYLLSAQDMLIPMGLLPGVLRVERIDPHPQWYASDFLRPAVLAELPKVVIKGSTHGFVNLPKPYQALYFLPRVLMQEHLTGPTFNPDHGPWHIRESAAQGLTFSKVPAGFFSRIMIPYDAAEQRISSDCFVHHLPNNYARNPKSKFAKVTVADLLSGQPSEAQVTG